MADLKKYPKTDLFRVKDTIGVPHPFCITAPLIAFVADNFMGSLIKLQQKLLKRKKADRSAV